MRTIVTPLEMADIDREAQEVFGMSGTLLMENAGRSAWNIIRNRYILPNLPNIASDKPISDDSERAVHKFKPLQPNTSRPKTPPKIPHNTPRNSPQSDTSNATTPESKTSIQASNQRTHPILTVHLVIFCGKGNNGGDGLVLARHALLDDCFHMAMGNHAGVRLDVKIGLVEGRQVKLSPDHYENLTILNKMATLQATQAAKSRARVQLHARTTSISKPPSPPPAMDSATSLNGSAKIDSSTQVESLNQVDVFPQIDLSSSTSLSIVNCDNTADLHELTQEVSDCLNSRPVHPSMPASASGSTSDSTSASLATSAPHSSSIPPPISSPASPITSSSASTISDKMGYFEADSPSDEGSSCEITIIVDALLGTGARGTLRGIYLDIVKSINVLRTESTHSAQIRQATLMPFEATQTTRHDTIPNDSLTNDSLTNDSPTNDSLINNSLLRVANRLRIVALDLPTGVYDGMKREHIAKGCVVRADLTIAFEMLKTTLLTPLGRLCAGNLAIAKVGFPNVQFPKTRSSKVGSSNARSSKVGFPNARSSNARSSNARSSNAGFPNAGFPNAGFPNAGAPDAMSSNVGVPDAMSSDVGSANVEFPKPIAKKPEKMAKPRINSSSSHPHPHHPQSHDIQPHYPQSNHSQSNIETGISGSSHTNTGVQPSESIEMASGSDIEARIIEARIKPKTEPKIEPKTTDARKMALKQPKLFYVEASDVYRTLKSLALHDYKKTRGRVGIVAGAGGTLGSAILATRAASHSFSGLVTLFAQKCDITVQSTRLIDEMIQPLETFNPLKTPPLFDAFLIGPGIDHRQAVYGDFLKQFQIYAARNIENSAKKPSEKPSEKTSKAPSIASSTIIPIVIDANGIDLLKKAAVKRSWNYPYTLLTPHAGELARLMDVSVSEVLASPLPILTEASRVFNAVILLKGQCSIIHAPNGTTAYVEGSNPFLGTGGSGDVLAGMITALAAYHLQKQHIGEDINAIKLSQNGTAKLETRPIDKKAQNLLQNSLFEAAWIAAYLHQQAGRLAFSSHGVFTASMLIPHLAKSIARFIQP